ncbi:MAG: rod shape-determining protein MreC [Bryobacteraceae bacterium]|nr:rod shape-determining protein MreC [Bryobacteraceae bacterium]
MDFLLNRYRSLTILVVVVLAQVVLLAFQVKTNSNVPLIRVWAVEGVTPLAGVFESFRSTIAHFIDDWLMLANAQAENRRMKDELGKLKLENHYLKSELATAQRAEALQAFQKRSPSKTVAARVVGTATGVGAKVVFADRGTTSGVRKGMAVITPDGIVGKVIASFPNASQVQLITDPSFAAGVVSGKNRTVGTLKGQGRSDVIVDYVQIEQPVEQGEWFYTSGDDRVFPKGLPVGQASVVRQGRTFKEIFVAPSGFQRGLEEVLIVVDGVHQQIPDDAAAQAQPVSLLPPPPQTSAAPPGGGSAPATGTAAIPDSLLTDADRLKRKYNGIGESVGYKFGEGMSSPNFNAPPKSPAPKTEAASPSANPPAQSPAQPAAKPSVPPPGKQ